MTKMEGRASALPRQSASSGEQQLLTYADLGITDIEVADYVVKKKLKELKSANGLPSNLQKRANFLSELARSFDLLQETFTVPALKHLGAAGSSFSLPWEAASLGTQRLFALAGPWFDILSKGCLVCIDELESSMHPLMVRALLQHFFSDAENRIGAQILFTTHNPLLLDTDILRRDQVWFTEKDYEGVTHLYPLTDYSPRKNESLVRCYLSGRYGGVPFIPAA